MSKATTATFAESDICFLVAVAASVEKINWYLIVYGDVEALVDCAAKKYANIIYTVSKE